jgi:hypothetical protein
MDRSMTPFVIVKDLLATGPKRKKEIDAAFGGRFRAAENALKQLCERKEIRLIHRGVYALADHPLMSKTR